MQVYRNTYNHLVVLYEEDKAQIKAEMGEYVFLHFSLENKRLWIKRKQVWPIILAELNRRGYKYAFALMPIGHKLTRHLIDDLGFEYLGDRDGYNLIRVGTTKLPIRLKRQSIQLS